jgi:hypothetical protein
MKALAWFVLIASAIITLYAPFQVGQKRIYEKSDAALSFVDFLLYLLLCGHIIGWW